MKKELTQNLTTEEKVLLLCGADMFSTAGIKRANVPSILMSDGPNGVKVYNTETTCYPNACLIASSWDKETAYQIAECIAKECNFYGVNMLLAPGVNIKRSPLCGRNFEYYSEDPLLAGELAAQFVTGLQKSGVGACVKHFAANNREKLRFVSNSILDDRALFDIYLKAFEIIVKKAKPYAIMSAYNLVNGVACAQNKRLLTDILRDSWGFSGIVISDWCAVSDAVGAVEAGLNVDMPSNQGITYNKLLSAVKSGHLSEETLNRAVSEVIVVAEILQSGCKPKAEPKENSQKNRRLAAEGIILLKNENKVLPLKQNEKVAVCGEFAVKPRVSGGGSANVGGKDCLMPLSELQKYLSGAFYVNADKITEDNAVEENLKNADKIVYFAGLNEEAESEGYDRENLFLPHNQIQAIKVLRKLNDNIIVVLQNGSAVETESWIDCAKAVVEMYYAGCAGGGAVADILCGKVNPSGRLAESFPKRLEDTPSYLQFGDNGKKFIYGESVFVGYRYYLSKKIPVSFPFGYGLSYSNFSYVSSSISRNSLLLGESITVKVNIKNTGDFAGKEVVQLYISCLSGGAQEPIRELKAFDKVFLDVNEKKEVEFVLDESAFTRYDTVKEKVSLISGEYLIQIGKNCEDIIFSFAIKVTNSQKEDIVINRNTMAGEILECGYVRDKVLNDLLPYIKKWFGIADDQALKLESPFIKHLVYNMPLRAFAYFSDGTLDDDNLNKLIAKIDTLLKRKE